ncbi:SPOR domain-containing protein [Oligoflexia bacterium]|nr:SPOR domain-containing protein [Oligoflexia bacterium]
MNKKNLRKWEVRLGLVQVVILVGVVTGSMAFAFYMGLFTGQKLGFEQALDSSVASAVRMPIVDDELDEEMNTELVSEVYAKLNDTEVSETEAAAKLDAGRKPIPVLDQIHSTDVVPVVVERQEQDPIAQEADEIKAGIKKSRDLLALNLNQNTEPIEGGLHEPEAKIRVLGGGSDAIKGASDNKKTLGAALVDSQKEKAQQKKIAEANAAAKQKASAEKRDKAKKTVALVQDAPKKKQVEVKKLIKAPKPVIEKKKVKKTVVPVIEQAKFPKRDTPVERKAYVGASIPSGWFAQVAAPKNMGDANSVAKRLKSSGFKVSIEHAQVRGQKYYRVLVGPENTRQHAERLLGQLKRETYLKGDPFIKMIR